MPTSPRPRRPSQPPRERARAREVVDTAITIFNERGYDGTSVEDIAEALGILKGSLYYYITSKEDLLFQTISETHAAVQELLDEAMARDDLSPLDRLIVYIRKQVTYNARNTARIAVYYRDMKRLSPARLKNVKQRRRTQDEIITTLLADAQAAGQIPADIDTKLAAQCVIGTMIWPYTWYKPRGGVSPERLADFCVQYVIGGISGEGTVVLAEANAD